MRKYFLLNLILLLSYASFAQVNGNMEAWSSIDLFEHPDDWYDANEQGWTTVTKETDKTEGTYSAKMECRLEGSDTIFGFMVLGSIDDTIDGGIPFTTTVDSICGDVKYSVVAGDTAWLLVNIWDGGAQETTAYPFTGSASAWTKFRVAINTSGYTSIDSVFVGVVCTNALNNDYHPGSWMQVDNIRFRGSGSDVALPNGGIEDWSTVSVEEPDNWGTFNVLGGAVGIITTEKSTDAYTGMYSAKMTTVFFEGDTLSGVLANGSVGFGGVTGGEAYTHKPDTFTGWYKLSTSTADTATIVVLFKKSGAIVGTGFMTFTANKSSWTNFNIPLLISATPDTVQIVIFNGSDENTVLMIDAMYFIGGTVGIQYLSPDDMGLKVFPNPTTGQVSFNYSLEDAGDTEISIYGIDGKLIIPTIITEGEVGNNQVMVDISNHPAGTYIYNFRRGEESVSGTIILD